MRLGWSVAMLALGAGAIPFAERGAEIGLNAVLRCGGPEKKWIMEANGAGVAVLDYDGDGWMDLVVVNGSSVDRLAGLMRTGAAQSRTDGVFLYRNDGRGRFEDVTAKSGLMNPYWGAGVNALDYDRDGKTDVLVTTIGRDLLFHNEGHRKFREVGAAAGLSQRIAWHTGSAFGDYNGDGFPDLYVAGYVRVDGLGIGGPAPVCEYLNLPVFCGPRNLKGEPDVLYRNNGDGTFTDVTVAAGVTDVAGRYGFAAVFEDLNGDGRPDILVANDSGPNFAWVNNGRGGFEESALSLGLAYNAAGSSMANMGIAVGDVDNDGDLDFLTTTFSEDYFPFFEQVQPGVYDELAAKVGLVAPTTALLGWACGFVDLDNDGWRDLWTANGHVYPTIAKAGTSSYEQQVVIFRNHKGSFRGRGEAMETRVGRSWRGGAQVDFNNDGKMDLVVTPVDGPPTLFENREQTGNHWIGIDLRGQWLGARVTVEGCGKRWFDTVRNGGSYLSGNDPRLHFGLGGCGSVDRVEIRQPMGRTETLKGPQVDRYARVH